MPSDYANDLMARVGLDTTEWKKGITDLNAGIKHIETGFQATAALMDDWGNSSEGLKKRIETLNDKLALQKQNLDILKKAYDEEVAANGEGSKAAEELGKKMYQAKYEIERTKTSIESYTDKLNNMSVISDKTAQKLETVANKTRKLSTVATASLAAVGAGLVKAGQNADELNTLAKQTGLTVEEIQKFQYASDLIDVELNDMTGALRKMTKNMVSTSSEVKAAWETLGVSTTKANGEAKGITETFYEVLEALSKVANETERDQLAMQIFGKSANDLAGIVDDGGTALRELGNEAENLGLIMSQDAVDGANEFNDVIDKLKANVTAELTKAFSENADELTETAETVAGAIVSAIKTISNLPSGVTKAGIAITTFTAVLSPLFSASSKTVSVMVKLKNAYKTKTAATVESTASEVEHAKAITNTGTAAGTTSKGLKGIGTAAKTASPYILAVAAALALVNLETNRTIKQAEKRIDETYDTLSEKEAESYDQIIENLKSEKEAKEDYYDSQTTQINDYYDNQIDLLDDKLEAEKKAIETEKKLYETAHDERMEQLEAERDLKLSNIDIEENAQTSALQKQIDALNALTEAEEKEEEERENQKKLAELQRAISEATTYAEKVDAENEYNEFVRKLELERTQNARELQIKELENQIETIRAESQAKREQADDEYEAAVKLEKDKYTTIQQGFENRLSALDTFIEDETEKLESARSKRMADLQSETDLYISQWQAAYDAQTKAREDALEDIEKAREKEKSELKTVKGFLTAFVSDYNFPHNASGTSSWRGGPTWVNEEGGEILNLPRGTQIIPHDVSMEMARAAGRASVTNTSTTNNTNTSNSYNYSYGAQQQVTMLNVDGRTIAKVVEPKVSVLMSDTIYRRRRSGGGG